MLHEFSERVTRTQWIGPEKKSPPKNQKLVSFAWVRWFVPGRYMTRQNQTSLPPFVLGDGTGQHQGLPLLSDPIPSFVGMAASQESHWRRLQTSEQKSLNAGRTATFCLKVCFESSLTESHWCESSEWGSAPIVPTWVVLWPQNPRGYFVLFTLVQTLSGPAFILLLLEGSGGWEERLMAADKGSAITDTLLARALPAAVQPTCRAPATSGYHPASAGWCRPFPVLLSRSSSPCKRTRQLCSPLLLKCMSDCVTQLDVPWFAQLSGQSCRKCHQLLILFGWIRKTPALYT